MLSNFPFGFKRYLSLLSILTIANCILYVSFFYLDRRFTPLYNLGLIVVGELLVFPLLSFVLGLIPALFILHHLPFTARWIKATLFILVFLNILLFVLLVGNHIQSLFF